MNETLKRKRGKKARELRGSSPEQTAARTVRSLSRVSAVLAAVTAGAVVFSIAFVGSAQSKLALLDSGTAPVLTATVPIESGAVIEEGMVEMRDVPAYAVVEGSLDDPSQAIGRQAIGPIPKNGQIGESELSSSKAALSLADALEPGMVALSLAVDEETGLAGLVRQGNAVDVVSLGGVVATSAKVLAVDESLDQAKSDYSTVTLQCSEEQAEAIHDAQANAPVRLVLRPAASGPSEEKEGGQ